MASEHILQQLLDRSMEQEAKLNALTTIITSMMTRAANDSHDPQQYVMTLIAPISEMARAFDPTDDDMATIGEALLDFADRIENNALSMLRDA